MATTEASKAKAPAKTEPAVESAKTRKPAGPTEFVILLGTPENDEAGGVVSWVPQTDGAGGRLLTYSVAARTKHAAGVAIEMHIGAPPNEKPGRWKAIPKDAWIGGVYVKEPEMVPQSVREALVD